MSGRRRETYNVHSIAGVAQLVARHLAKVKVASSSLVARSRETAGQRVFRLPGISSQNPRKTRLSQMEVSSKARSAGTGSAPANPAISALPSDGAAQRI